MKQKTLNLSALALVSLFVASAPARAAITVSEVAPWSSGNSPVGADWFELTNTGLAAVSISGWLVDDNSNAFATAVALRNVSNIAPGQSVVFVESAADGSTDAARNAAFISNWFAGVAPAGFVIGNYGGPGIGLGTAGDAVNIFTSTGTLVTRVDFGTSTPVPGLATFDNAAGLSGTVTLRQISVPGVNGAFLVTGSPGNTEVGSPGLVAAVPEPGTYALLALGLLALAARVGRNSKRAL